MAVYTRFNNKQIAAMSDAIGHEIDAIHGLTSGTNDSKFWATLRGSDEKILITIHETPDVNPTNGQWAEKAAKGITAVKHLAEKAIGVVAGMNSDHPYTGNGRDVDGRRINMTIPMPYMWTQQGETRPYGTMKFPHASEPGPVDKAISIIRFYDQAQVIDFAEGQPAPPQEAYRAARALAEVHNLGEDYDKLNELDDHFTPDIWVEQMDNLLRKDAHPGTSTEIGRQIERDALDKQYPASYVQEQQDFIDSLPKGDAKKQVRDALNIMHKAIVVGAKQKEAFVEALGLLADGDAQARGRALVATIDGHKAARAKHIESLPKQDVRHTGRALLQQMRDSAAYLAENWEEKMAGLDYGMLHGDFYPDNALRSHPVTVERANDRLVVIDFGAVSSGFTGVGLALAVNAWGAGDKGVEDTFLRGYDEVRPIDDKLKESFNFVRAAAAQYIAMMRAFKFAHIQPGQNVSLRSPQEPAKLAAEMIERDKLGEAFEFEATPKDTNFQARLDREKAARQQGGNAPQIG